MLLAVVKCSQCEQANKGVRVLAALFTDCCPESGLGQISPFLSGTVFGHLCQDFKMFVTFSLVILLLRLYLKE